MKLVGHFRTFLAEEVNLNDERIDRLRGHVAAIQAFLVRSDYGAERVGFSPQGSWAHKTIIRPPTADGRFDADLVMFVRPNDTWRPADYVDRLWSVFRASPVYRDKVTRNTRCVTIEYAKDFDLDVVPVIQRDLTILDGLLGARTTYSICNRREDREEPTDPMAYTAWIADVDSASHGMLRRVTRLLKYLRDTKSRFSVKSVLLTTLLTQRAEDRIADGDEDCWSDVPTSLRTLVGDLDDWLQARPTMPFVENPKVPGEQFTRHWDQERYTNFRACMSRYRGWVDAAYLEPDRDASILAWRRLFGDAFAEGVVVEAAQAPAARSADESDKRLVEQVFRHGLSFLRSIGLTADHQEEPRWHRSNARVSVEIQADLHASIDGAFIEPMGNAQVVGPDRAIRFRAVVGTGGLPHGWRIAWRVTNTGAEALRRGQPRGGFQMGRTRSVERWETTAYLGVHWVDAFVLDDSDRCRGQSERFYVVVDK